MKFSNYYLLGVIFSTIKSFEMSFDLGMTYVLFAAINILTVLWYKPTSFFVIPLLISHLTYFCAYYLRPFILVSDLKYFLFYDVIRPDMDLITSTMQMASFSYIFIMIGFILVTKLVSFEKKLVFRGLDGFVVKHLNIIIIVGVGLVLLKMFLFFVFGIGAKGVENTSSLAFLQRLIPEDLFFIITMLCAFIIHEQVPKKELYVLISVALFFSFAILMTGSKIFIMRMGFFYLTYLVYCRVSIPIPRMIILGASGLILITASFIMSHTMRTINYLGLDPSFSVFMELSGESYAELDGIEMYESVTERLNGLDGLIVSQEVMENKNKFDWDALGKSFNLYEYVLRILEMMIPMVEITDSVPIGISISWYIFKFDKDFIFAGSVGLVGEFAICAQSFDLLPWVLMAYGAILGFIFGFIKMLNLEHLRFALCSLIAFFMMFLNINGCFDTMLTEFFVKLILIFVYGGMIMVIRQIIKKY